jgi:hypothetical protein
VAGSGTLPTEPRRNVTVFGRGFEPLIAEMNEWDVGARMRRPPGHEVFNIGMIPIPASFRREARMVLKTLKLSLSVLAAATSVASLFAVSWVGLALLGY